MGEPTYIPYSEIDAYCRLKNIIFPAERERLVRMVDVLDREWMRQHLEKREKEDKTSPKAPPPSQSPPRHRPRTSTRKQVSS